ncbi:MAG: RnfABCDGE type electron transport complex subunit G [Deltaproteobacteria bacterium]|nr:RnfABCDGE type electron transport complex subunit G [Deltaproteobacteria bacterium]
MREIIKLFVIVALFSAIAGGVLASVRNATLDKIEMQELKYVRGPALEKLFAGSSNDPLTDRFKIKDGDKDMDVFIGEFSGKKNVVAFETSATGYDGKVGVMVGYNLDTDELVGMRVTTHTETPGVGSRATTETSFINQFKGMSIDSGFKVKADGGDIDALSGATITSRGVSAAVANSIEIYKRLKDEIRKNIQA